MARSKNRLGCLGCVASVAFGVFLFAALATHFENKHNKTTEEPDTHVNDHARRSKK